MKNLVLLAPPAAGKGTLAEKLVKNFKYISISTGDLLREKAKSDEKIANMMATGKLIDDEIVFELLEKKLSKINDPYILDGFPRTLKQAIMYDDLLEKLGKDIGAVIYLDAKKEDLINRIKTRLICPKCKISYSTIVKELLPGPNNTCLKCNSEVVSRDDDKEEIFKLRYTEYIENTTPLINHYLTKGNLYKINATKHDEIFDEVSSIIKE